MELGGPPRPRVSRETRLLLVTVLISIVTLWVLARVRFPERPVTPNPVPPLLAQLPARPTFEDLALAVAELESRLAPSLLPLELEQRPRPVTSLPSRRMSFPRCESAMTWRSRC